MHFIYLYKTHIIFITHLYIPISCHMFFVFDISPIYVYTVFLCFVIFYLSLSFLALMHFYHVFIACFLYSFRYVYHIFISYISYSSTYHLIHYLSNGSYYISYSVHVIFLYIYYFHGYILYTIHGYILYTICYVLFSCTVFMYCDQVLSSYTVSPYCIIILTFKLILHSHTFSYIMSDCIISCYRTYHHIAVLCFSYHIISFHMSYSNQLVYVSCL